MDDYPEPFPNIMETPDCDISNNDMQGIDCPYLNVKITASPDNYICGYHGSLNLSITDMLGGAFPFVSTPTFQWYRNNVAIPSATSLILTIYETGTYRCLVQDSICIKRTDPINITRSNLPTLTYHSLSPLTIDSNTATINACVINTGDAVMQAPIFVTLYKNDTIFANIIKIDTIKQNINVGDTFCLNLSLNNLCGYAPMTSLWISINDSAKIYPYRQQCAVDGRRKITSNLAFARDTLKVNITATSTSICSGENVTFTANTVGGSSLTYQWKKNGGNVGSNSSTYTDNTLLTGDQVTCVVTSSNQCTVLQSPPNTITMTTKQKVTPTIKIRAVPHN